MYFDQSPYQIRCEWGEHGVAVLAPISDVVIIVDVLSFSTCVDVAVSRGAIVYPYRGSQLGAADFAAAHGAALADKKRSVGQFSLSPESLLTIPPGTRIVLPSPNGSTLSLSAGGTPVLAGCLRNAQAVALAAMGKGTRIAVIPAGERWHADGSMRPSYEDLLGAGAIISHLAGTLSPEAKMAQDAYQAAQPDLQMLLEECSSGRELIERGYAEDVRLAAQLNFSTAAPILMNNSFMIG